MSRAKALGVRGLRRALLGGLAVAAVLSGQVHAAEDPVARGLALQALPKAGGTLTGSIAECSTCSINWGDVFLRRDAANTLALRNGANPNSLKVANSFTDLSNADYAIFDWLSSSNVLTIGTVNNGTFGTARNMRFVIGGVNKADYGVTNAGGWTWVGGFVLTTGNLQIPSSGSFTWSNGTSLASTGSGIFQLQNNGNTNNATITVGASNALTFQGAGTFGDVLTVGGTTNSVFAGPVAFGNRLARAGVFDGGSDGAHIQISGGNGSLVLDSRLTHILTQFATAPAITSCGTSPSVVTGTDIAGQFTTGTGTPTSCTLTFNVAYGAAPSCIVQDATALTNLTSFTTSTTTLVLTTSAASSQKIMYHCMSTS